VLSRIHGRQAAGTTSTQESAYLKWCLSSKACFRVTALIGSTKSLAVRTPTAQFINRQLLLETATAPRSSKIPKPRETAHFDAGYPTSRPPSRSLSIPPDGTPSSRRCVGRKGPVRSTHFLGAIRSLYQRDRSSQHLRSLGVSLLGLNATRSQVSPSCKQNFFHSRSSRSTLQHRRVMSYQLSYMILTRLYLE